MQRRNKKRKIIHRYLIVNPKEGLMKIQILYSTTTRNATSNAPSCELWRPVYGIELWKKQTGGINHIVAILKFWHKLQ